MSRGSHIVAVGTEHSADAGQGPLEETPPALVQEEEDFAGVPWDDAETEAARAPWPWHRIAPIAAATVVAAWTAFFVWAVRAEMFAPATPDRWIAWISSWSLPVLLVGMVWLIALRNSRREASRFGQAARLLADESSRLEERLVTINRELSLAREFLAAQSRDLNALGRLATDRLSSNADRLQGLIQENSTQIEGIGAVSSAALENMERLRGQLPVIASTAKDVTNHIANAGRTAHAQLQEMVHGFNRLNEFGQASDRQVSTMREKVSESIAEFARHAEQLGEIAATRFAAFTERGEEFRAQLDHHEIDALAAIRTRADALAAEIEETRTRLDQSEAESLTSLRARLSAVRDEGQTIARAVRDAEAAASAAWREQAEAVQAELHGALAALDDANGATADAARARFAALAEEARHFDERLTERNALFAREMERQRKQADEQEAAAIALIDERIARLDEDIAIRQQQQRASAAALTAEGEAVIARLAEVGRRFAEVAEHGSAAEAALSASLATLAERLNDGRLELSGTEADIARLTEASVRLLELIRAGAHHSSEDLPAALASGESRLEALSARVFAVRDAVNEAGARGDSLSAYVLTAGEAVRGTMAELNALHDRIEERGLAHGRQLEELNTALTAVGAESAKLAARAKGELARAIEQLSDTAREAIVQLEHNGAAAVSEIARKLGEDSKAAIEQALRERSDEIAGSLEAAASQAAGVSREAAVQLRDQLAKVNELAGNLERRVAHARQRAEEQVDNDFARRAALITESLNSSAIDIAKALSDEVSDTAWSAYLRGDRGIFTRRAVSLLDTTEAKAIAQLYESDRDFTQHVNRYIHDFEAMLRQLLSTRDGHALGVTLLSSDMGKLYVALAQAIERLRA